MPGRDGTGPLGTGPCGKHGGVCRKRIAAPGKGKAPERRRKPEPGEGPRTF